MTFIREASSKMYSPVVFAMSQLAAEMPYSILCSVVFFLLLYYPVGFNTDSVRAGYGFGMILLTELFAVTMGQAVAALAPTIYAAAMTNPFLLVIFSLFCGVTIPKPDMPRFFRVWLYYLVRGSLVPPSTTDVLTVLVQNPMTWLIAGLVTNELHGLEIRVRPVSNALTQTCTHELRATQCLDSEYRTIQPPSGQSCQDWMGPYVENAGGYLLDPNATADCRCTLTSASPSKSRPDLDLLDLQTANTRPATSSPRRSRLRTTTGANMRAGSSVRSVLYFA